MADRDGRTRRAGWNLGAGDPATVIAEARKALFVMVGFLAILWIVQIINVADHYQLTDSYGIQPREISSLPDILTAPFLHFSWAHIEGNSGPLFIFGLLAAYRGVVRFLGVTLVVAITSGMAVWLFQSDHTLSVGASGLIFGYFGYVLARGLIERSTVDTLIAVVMGLSYYYLLTIAVPGAPSGVSWIDHLGGLVGGLASAWIFRTRRGQRVRTPKPPRGSGGSGSGGGSTGTVAIPIAADHPRADLYKELGDMGL
jgi:membrane associated rhomboid family serine protease